jgi:hypothetical protein
VRAVKPDSPGIDTKCLPSHHSIFKLVEKNVSKGEKKKKYCNGWHGLATLRIFVFSFIGGEIFLNYILSAQSFKAIVDFL